MTEHSREVVITGIGLVSSLGEGIDRHIELLTADAPVRPSVEADAYAPYFIHPLPEIDWGRQIPKRSDQRQMDTWQKLGTYAAGLALEDAAIPADEGVRAKIDMVVAAGGGERDAAVDSLVMERARGASDVGAVVNETLSSELRPTLFLSQLSNLLAGNISIVHKITGSSRTFMGEEAAGISAVSSVFSRIAAGQSDICLVGGSFSAERKDLILNFDLAGLMLRDAWAPVSSRREGTGGFAPGSIGAFLVMECAEHAEARGARVYAKVTSAKGDRGRRADPAQTTERFAALLPEQGEATTVLSGATGLAALGAIEREVLAKKLPDAPSRSYGTMLGHGFEAQVTAGMALAAGALHAGARFTPFDGENEAAPIDVPPRRAVVTSLGHLHAEGVVVLEAFERGGSA